MSKDANDPLPLRGTPSMQELAEHLRRLIESGRRVRPEDEEVIDPYAVKRRKEWLRDIYGTEKSG